MTQRIEDAALCGVLVSGEMNCKVNGAARAWQCILSAAADADVDGWHSKRGGSLVTAETFKTCCTCVWRCSRELQGKQLWNIRTSTVELIVALFPIDDKRGTETQLPIPRRRRFARNVSLCMFNCFEPLSVIAEALRL